MIFPGFEEVVPVRSRREFAALAGAVVVGSVGALSRTAAATPAALGGSVVAVTDCEQTLRMDPDSGFDGVIGLWFDDGRIVFFGRRISGGTIRFGGDVTVRSGARLARLTDLIIDVGTGTVNATLDTRPLRLATLDTRDLRLRKRPGDAKLSVGIGGERFALTDEGAAALNTALGGVGLTPGGALLVGGVVAGLPVDAEFAAQVNTTHKALVEYGVDVTVRLDGLIDVADHLYRD